MDKEREFLRQRKVRGLKQRSKYMNDSNRLQVSEVKDANDAEETNNERNKHIVENSHKQRAVARVDRRWEFETLARVEKKLLNKAEKNIETTVKRVRLEISYYSEFLRYINRSCSNLAFRFAEIKTNWRYIPGD